MVEEGVILVVEDEAADAAQIAGVGNWWEEQPEVTRSDPRWLASEGERRRRAEAQERENDLIFKVCCVVIGLTLVVVMIAWALGAL